LLIKEKMFGGDRAKKFLGNVGERLGGLGEQILPLNIPGVRVQGKPFGRWVGEKIGSFLPFRKGGMVKRSFL